MNDSLKRRSRRYVARHKARKKMAGIVLVLSIIVSLGVTMFMRENLSALTLTCGNEEHIHTDSCYGFVCGMEEHEHTDACFDEDGFLICELQEHVHDDTCKELVCGMKEHVHESSCYGGDEDEITQVFATAGDVAVTLTYDNAEDAERLSTIGLNEISEYDKQYDELIEKAQEVIDEGQETIYARFFEITPMEEGYVKGEPDGSTNVVLSLYDYLDIDQNTTVKVVHIPDNDQVVEIDAFVEDNEELTITFETDSFSVFGVIYTVDLSHALNGKTYEYKIKGGDVVSFKGLMPLLGIDNLSVNDISSIEFSNESLLKPVQVDYDMTAGELKSQYGLQTQYSSELTAEEIDAMNAKMLSAPDWALVSLKPFFSDETLTVKLNNGDQFTIDVKDELVMSTNEVDGTGTTGYVIYTEMDNKAYVLSTDGTTFYLEDKNDLNTISNEYKWKFTYVYTEKNVTPNLVYYNIRPYNNNYVSMDVSWQNDGGVNIKNGANNVYLLPFDEQGGFEFGGYNNARIATYDNGYFYNDMYGNRSRIFIYKEGEAEYDFTVATEDARMGFVESFLRNGTAASTVGENGSTVTFDTVTDSSFTNKYAISARTTSEKFLFDYWELNGSKVDGLSATIEPGQLSVPKTGSALVAHYKVNPNYDETDKRGRTPRDIDLDSWIQSILDQQKPLVETGCDKTAVVFDYENRIYRVDLTAQSQMSSFIGTIDLGFVIDVSGSMKFPSHLINLEKVVNIQPGEPDYDQSLYGTMLHFDNSRINGKGETEVNLTTINDNVNGKTRGEAWGMDKSKEYFVLLDYGELPDRSPTGTVCYLYYNHNGSKWVLCDSSKAKGSDDFDVTDNSKKAYYKPNTNPYYAIKVAGDLVTSEEWNDPATRAIMNKTNVREGHYKTRAYYLEKSINEAIDTLDQIVEKLSVSSDMDEDRKVRIAWNTFCNYLPSQDDSYTNASGKYVVKKSNQNSFLTIDQDENPIELIYAYDGGTSTDIALLDAAGYTTSEVSNKHLKSDVTNWKRGTESHSVNKDSGGFVWDEDSTKFAILITDGMPQRSSNGVDTSRVYEAVKYLKSEDLDGTPFVDGEGKLVGPDATLVSVGLSMADLAAGSELMYDISSKDEYGDPYYYEASNGSDLSKILYEIIQTLIVPATSIGTITDTVNEAFYPIDVNTGEALKVDDWIDLNGQRISDAAKQTYTGPHGVVSYEDGLYSVKWESQDITWVNEETNGWHGTLYVKAKEKFIGGNGVRTNQEYIGDDGSVVDGATIEVTHIKGVNDVSARPLNQNFISEGKKTSQTPRVNVNELDLIGSETEWIVYNGTQVTPYEQLKNMMNNIHAKEVVSSESNDLASDGKSSYVYPLEANSIGDQREDSAQGTNLTFSLSDELKALYREHMEREHGVVIEEGKELETLLDEAIASSTGSVSMPYDLYGQEVETCGTIKVEIKEIADEYKAIAELQKQIDNLTAEGASSEDIEVLRQKVQESEKRIADIRKNLSKEGHNASVDTMENYTLVVKFTPNYAAVPVGQGGDPALEMDEKFHTGKNGSAYQGHAAGTDESANIHSVKPYVKKVEIIKTDEGGIHGNALTGAQFTLYAKQSESDELVQVYDSGDKAFVLVEALKDNNGTEYYLKETVAPQGFKLYEDPISLDVTLTDDKNDLDGFVGVYNWKQDGIVKLGDLKEYTKEDVKQLLPEETDEESEEDSDPVAYFVIPNERGMTLPESGGNGTLPIRLAGLAVMAAALALLLSKRNRN